jgi:hypothetical protein
VDAAGKWAALEVATGDGRDVSAAPYWNSRRSMTGRPDKVRQIYAELRRSVGAVMPAIELLRLAAALVEATHSSFADDEYSVYRPELANGQLPLDEAFADGGWRMMEREWRWIGRSYWDDDPRSATRKRNWATTRLAA